MKSIVQRIGRLLPALVFVGLLAGCSSLSVTTDHDPGTDFTALKTYDWIPNPSGQPQSLAISSFRRAIDSEMAARGFEQDSNNPDLKLAMHAGIEEVITGATVNSWGYGMGSWNRWGGMGSMSTSTVSVQSYNRGTLLLDMVDTSRNELVWRGVAEKAVDNPSQARENAPKVAARLLEDFPPGQ